MKTCTSLQKTFAAASLAGLCCIFSSCLKDKTSDVNPPAALVSFFQASPDEPPIDLYFNNNWVGKQSLAYGNGLDYFRAFAGQRTVNFYIHGVMSKILSDTITLRKDSVYSLFLANGAGKPEAIWLKDTLNRPAPNTANIRFVSLCSDCPAVDLSINDTIRVSNRNYKGFSSFFGSGANRTFTIRVLEHGAGTVLASLRNLSLINNQDYTIIFSGLLSGTTVADKPAIFYVANASF